MADPLSQLRQYYINGDLNKIQEYNGYLIFGDCGWPRNVSTNYQVYSTEDDRKEFYSLECLYYFLKHIDLAHHHYVKQSATVLIPAVHRPDRKLILAYLRGEIESSPSIDKNAPIPPLRLPASEIYNNNKKEHQPQPSTSSQSTNHDSMRSESKKRPHDPEMEERVRKEFAARLNEPSAKKIATIIPIDSADKSGDGADGLAVRAKFNAEKLAAYRAKHLAVKRTTIIDADEVGKQGLGASDPNDSGAKYLIELDSDHSRLIKTKEKIWRTRTTILQSQSKNFLKTVGPLIEILCSKSDNDANKKISNQMPPVPADMQLNTYQNQQQQQQQSIQRNAYNRYDQERFVKLDIGVEIDTKKSFVSGPLATSLVSYNGQTHQTANNRLPTNNQNLMVPPTSHPHHPSSRSNDVIDSRRKITTTPRPTKRNSTTPIIIIPATTTSLINMFNAKAILEDLTYVEGAIDKGRESDVTIVRKRPDGVSAPYKILDNPSKLDAEDWNRVVAVFVQGPAWQFKGWPWGGSPVEIFSRIKGFHLKWDEAKLDDNVARWNVHVLELSRSKRHLDKANLLKFWSSLDAFMMKYKNFLKF